MNVVARYTSRILTTALGKRSVGSITQKNEQDFTKLKNEWWAPRGEFEVIQKILTKKHHQAIFF